MDLSEQPVSRAFLRHPWELAKRHFLIRLVHTFGLDSGAYRMVDAGAGDGWLGLELLRVLPEGSRLISWDIHYDMSSDPSPRHRRTPKLDDTDVGDMLLALDVLEHVDDPHEWLAELVSRHLRTGGYAIISVPAWPALYGEHDRALGHRCRFRPDGARGLLEGAGLEIICAGGLFLSLLPIRVIGTVWGRLLRPAAHASDPRGLEWRWGRFTHRLMVGALTLDSRLSLALARRKVLVPGLSWWALCRKNSHHHPLLQ